MLKIKDETGKTVGVLKDDDDAPQMVAGDILPEIKSEEDQPEEGEEDGSDIR